MNIKVFHWQVDDSHQPREETSYKITESDGNVTIDFTGYYKNILCKGSYTFNPEECKKTVKELFIYENDGYSTKVVEAFTYCNRDGYNTAQLNRQKFARVVVDENGDVYIFLAFIYGDVDGYENISMVREEYPQTYYLVKYCPWFAERLAFIRKKATLIKQVDPYNSIAYLEAQVDLLTRLVISLMDGTATKADYLTALKVADEYSVLTVKDMDAVTEEFTVNKKNFRELQKEYYEALK